MTGVIGEQDVAVGETELIALFRPLAVKRAKRIQFVIERRYDEEVDVHVPVTVRLALARVRALRMIAGQVGSCSRRGARP